MKKLNFESTTLLITLKDNEIYSNKLVNYLNFQNFNIQIFKLMEVRNHKKRYLKN